MTVREALSRVRGGATRLPWSSVAWLVAASALIAAFATLIVIGFVHSPVDVDEGYGLSIVRNLAGGKGFASDAIGNEGRSGVFDPRASTGPTVLLPAAALHALGLDIVVAGRIVGTAFALALAAGLALWGWRVGGRWAALGGASAPLVLDTFSSDISPIYGPTDMLGEMPAAALMVWAFVAVARRPRLAALMAGLAILAKLVALMMVPALIVAFISTTPKGRWPRGLAISAAIAAAPLFAYELAAFATLGVAGDRARLGQYAALMREDRISGPLIPEKLVTIASAWFVPRDVAIAIALTIAASAALAWGWWARRHGGNQAAFVALVRDPRGAIITVGAIAAGVPVAQWLSTTSTSAQWIRHPAPALIVGIALILVVVATALTHHAKAPGWRGVAFMGAGVMVAALVAFQAAHHIALALEPQRYGTLGEQREFAERIRDTGTPLTQGPWSAGMTISAMADLDMVDVNFDAVEGALVLVDEYPRAVDPAFIGPQRDAWCGEIVFDGPMVACWPLDTIGTQDSH